MYLQTHYLHDLMYEGFKLSFLAQILLPFAQASEVIVGSHKTLVGGNRSS